MLNLETLKYIIIGASLGLSSGISPGPLLTLVLSETITHGRKGGIRIAISPLITDLPIVLGSLFLFSRLSDFRIIVSLISIAGAVFVGYLGYQSLITKSLNTRIKATSGASLKKGVITNFLNPHPYLFWVIIGAPLAVKALSVSSAALILFFLSLYVCLVGSKIVIVFLVAGSKRFIGEGSYIWLMRVLGVILFVFSFFFLMEGLKYFFR